MARLGRIVFHSSNRVQMMLYQARPGVAALLRKPCAAANPANLVCGTAAFWCTFALAREPCAHEYIDSDAEMADSAPEHSKVIADPVGAAMEACRVPRAVRRQVRLPCSLSVEGMTLRGFVSDVSVSGARVLLPRRLVGECNIRPTMQALVSLQLSTGGDWMSARPPDRTPVRRLIFRARSRAAQDARHFSEASDGQERSSGWGAALAAMDGGGGQARA